MGEEQGAQLKLLPYRKNYRLVLAYMFVLCFIVPLKLSIADNIKHSNIGLQELKKVAATDWVAYSPDATKVAIVRTKHFSGAIPFGVLLQIYSVDSELQPKRLLFEDNNNSQFITEFQWVKDHLVYLTVNTNNPTEQLIMKWLRGVFVEQGEKDVTNHAKVKIWPNDLAENSDLSAVKFIPPGKIFSSKGSDALLFFDVYEETAQDAKKTPKALSPEHSINSFKIPSGKLQYKLTANIRLSASRWPFSGKGLVPLFLSSGNSRLIAVVFLNGAWNNTYQSGPSAIISIDLSTGEVDTITSDKWLNSLHLPNGSDPQYFVRGNPIPVNNGKQLVCLLSRSRASADMAFRFAFYDLNGKKQKEVFVFEKDLKQAGISSGLLVTWTPDGNQMLTQDGNIWLYNWQKKTSIQIAQTAWVEDVMGWVDDHHLLVRVVTPDPKSKVPLTDQFISSHKKWALLTIPEAGPVKDK